MACVSLPHRQTILFDPKTNYYAIVTLKNTALSSEMDLSETQFNGWEPYTLWMVPIFYHLLLKRTMRHKNQLRGGGANISLLVNEALKSFGEAVSHDTGAFSHSSWLGWVNTYWNMEYRISWLPLQALQQLFQNWNWLISTKNEKRVIGICFNYKLWPKIIMFPRVTNLIHCSWWN